jgi:hypothetical protein
MKPATTISSAALYAQLRTFPGVKPFVEAGADTRKHDLNADFFGYQRNLKWYHR